MLPQLVNVNLKQFGITALVYKFTALWNYKVEAWKIGGFLIRMGLARVKLGFVINMAIPSSFPNV